MIGINSGFATVKTLEGDIYIKDMKAGMPVKTSKHSFHHVQSVKQELMMTRTVVYSFSTVDGYEAYRFADEQLVMTDEGWKPVEELTTSNSVLTLYGMKKVTEIKRMETMNKIFYSLEVTKGHCYFVDGILVSDEDRI